MAHFDRTDPHFVVHFVADETLLTLSKNKVGECDDEGKVKIMWKTSKLKEDGTEVIEDMPYDGTIVFSGSLIKCRAYTQHVDQDLNTFMKGTIEALISLGKEMKSSGRKRGANLKMKRALEEAKELPNEKKKKEDQTVKGTTSKSAKLKELKLKEIMAFAGLNDEVTPKKTPDKDAKSNEKTPSKALKNSPRRPEQSKTPEKKLKQTKTPAKRCKESKTPGKKTSSTTPTKYDGKFRDMIYTQITPIKRIKTPQKKLKTPLKPNNENVQVKENHKTLNLPTKLIKTPEKRIHKQQKTPFGDTASLVGISLGILNEGDDHFEEYSEEFCPSISTPQSSKALSPLPVGEYGYNADIGIPTCKLTNNFPYQPLIDYYQSLPHGAQTQVLSVFHLLTNAFHQCTYGGTINDDNVMEPSFSVIEKNSIQQTEQVKRKVPLIIDDNDLYIDVKVNPSALRTAEMKALTAKNPAIYLLNKILDLVFTEEDLKETKGVKGLDSHKMEAIKEYMFAKCNKLQINQLPPNTFMTTVQNKIGNIRQKIEKNTHVPKLKKKEY